VRRSELESADGDLFRDLAATCEVGYLSLVTAEGYPRAIALNFAAVGKTIYFHGALEGEKFELIQASPRAGFSIVKPYSFIPSVWSAPRYACPATHFFKSIEIKGICSQVDDPAEKARGLNALMDKHQPEGGFDPIDPGVPVYAKALAGVGVFRVVADSWTGKVKFGQNEPEKLRRIFVEKLRERGGVMDEETAREIELTLAINPE
jgi:nitroimidazol reductase NimA-like FMN-containing flavoprotein (pyridoxamine 5'-phosphate oxidase superfamily)